MYHQKRHIHFVGIGGIGMSGIAEILLNLGHGVSGSDLQSGAQTQRLQNMGAKIFLGHLESQVEHADVVVVSSAILEDNPEIQQARLQRIPVIPRAEMLAELMRLKNSVAVAGSHGKTTTCSLLGTILTEGGLDPTLIIGGKVNNLGTNARLGQGEFLVAEADESDGSFLLLSPTVTVVTNIDREHMNYYRDLEHLKETFLTFINRVPFYGFSVLCLDDPEVQSLIPKIKKRYMTYGLSAQSMMTARDITLTDWGFNFEVVFMGETLGRLEVNIPGRHNVLNSLAAITVAMEMGVKFDKIAKGISKLSGVGRRLEKKGEKQGITFLDDYGHHPTEIRATLAALAECYPERRKIVLFQPHRYTRTNDLFQEFLTSFNQADRLYLADIYPAGEKPQPGPDSRDSKDLAEAIRLYGHEGVTYVGNVNNFAGKVIKDLKAGDVVLTLGAGNIWEAGETLFKQLPVEQLRT
ncbi:MAG: UDP-N-acetylmuramate--L-alanine ligase [Deltaproteobacteria bacterium]|jgi:UDP-N-acetylmuramate--alanine ligase|nr:UDP-N-acetylmuramate--L-alanine ligase [Deltaproteobacteria bacterium]